jgi:hypothetical protein
MTKALLPILGACLFAGWMGWLQMGGVLFLLTMFALSGWMVWFRFALTWRSFTDLMVIPSFWGGVLGAVYALSLGWREEQTVAAISLGVLGTAGATTLRWLVAVICERGYWRRVRRGEIRPPNRRVSTVGPSMPRWAKPRLHR